MCGIFAFISKKHDFNILNTYYNKISESNEYINKLVSTDLLGGANLALRLSKL